MYLPLSWAPIATIAIVSLTLTLIASFKEKTIAYSFFTKPKVVYLGLISYSLYLWHWSILSISRWTIGIHWWSIPFQLALIIFLAISSYRWIEKPLRKSNWFGKRFHPLIVSGGFLFTLSGFILLLDKPFNGKIFSDDTRETFFFNRPRREILL